MQKKNYKLDAEAAKWFTSTRKRMHDSNRNTPNARTILAYAKKKGWNSQFPEEDVDALCQILGPKLREGLRKLEHLINHLEGLIFYHQRHLFLEQTGPSRREIYSHLDSLLRAIDYLEKGFEVDEYYLLRPIVSNLGGKDAGSNVLKSLEVLRRAVSYRRKITAKDGRPPKGARSLIALLLASILDVYGIPPTTSNSGPYIAVLSIILRQQADDDGAKDDKIDRVVKEAIREFKLRKANPKLGWDPLFFIPMSRK